MDKQDAQDLFKKDYRASFGIKKPIPIVATVFENKHGIDNPVEDLKVTNSSDIQDAIGNILMDTNTIDLVYDPTVPEITGDVRYQDSSTVDLSDNASGLKADVRYQKSITADSNGIELQNDSTSPGNSKYYGTDSGGTKGFFSFSEVTGLSKEPLTNGDVASPELIFANGDVIMV